MRGGERLFALVIVQILRRRTLAARQNRRIAVQESDIAVQLLAQFRAVVGCIGNGGVGRGRGSRGSLVVGDRGGGRRRHRRRGTGTYPHLLVVRAGWRCVGIMRGAIGVLPFVYLRVGRSGEGERGDSE